MCDYLLDMSYTYVPLKKNSYEKVYLIALCIVFQFQGRTFSYDNNWLCYEVQSNSLLLYYGIMIKIYNICVTIFYSFTLCSVHTNNYAGLHYNRVGAALPCP